jgi:uncharacterized protein YutE (UPF0331/DUF86 family)
MYYMDRKLMERKLSFLTTLGEQAQELAESANGAHAPWTSLHGLAQERLLHLAMEAVTDTGHMLIDCFMMRDAGSYEDIINILFEERVFAEEVHAALLELVRLKSALVKEYEHRMAELHPLLPQLAVTLTAYAVAARTFTKSEFANIGE